MKPSLLLVLSSLIQTRNSLPEGLNIIIKQQLCGEGFPSLLPLLQADVFHWKQRIIYVHQTSQKKLVSGPVIQIISPKVLQESTTILQLKVYIVSVMKNKLGTHLSRSVLLIWLHSFSHLPGMQDLWIISFFFFFHEVSHHKVRKVMDPNFCK